MTIADQLREKGIAKGRREGIEKGLESVATNLLLQGLDVILVENATGLSRKGLAKLQKNIRTTHYTHTTLLLKRIS